MKDKTTHSRDAKRYGDCGRFAGRSGFTLVELLMVITIIGMLSAISITTVRAAIQSARETQTRTTITKLDAVMTAAYEKYQYRRFEVEDYYGDGVNARTRAFVRVQMLRDLVRRDFPCTPNELTINAPSNYVAPYREPTPLQYAYQSEINRSPTGLSADSVIANAELLYLVLTNVAPEARASFAEREVADVDGNGLKEFVDGWGRPICWMRWAPGLERSDRQPLCEDALSEWRDFTLPNGAVEKRFENPDDAEPFDPLGVSNGWFLVPYIYSAGPDGEYGLQTPETCETTINNKSNMDDPFIACGSDPFNYYGDGSLEVNSDLIIGLPKDKTYKDNIDNHTLVR